MIKSRTFVVLCVSAVILLWDLGALNVTIMEARNFVTAREMVEDGSYLVPTLNGAYRLAKPPLPTWLTAFVGGATSMKSVFWLRVPAVFFGLLALFFSMKIVKNQSESTRDPALAGVILVTSFYFFWTSRSGMWDIFAQSFMMAGIYCYVKSWQQNRNSLKYTLLFSICCAASLMSKGPVALYGLFLPFLLSYHVVYKNELNVSKTKIWSLIGAFLLAILIAFLWPMYIHFSDAGQAASEILKKETSNWSTYNVKPWYYYASFPTQAGVWTAFGFLGLIGYSLFYRRMTSNKSLRFYFWWTVLVVVLLSLVPEKKSRYLLPVLFPMAMFIAEAIQSVEFARMQTILKSAAIITALSLALAGIVIAFDLRTEVKNLDAGVIGGLLLICAALWSLYLSIKNNLTTSSYVLAGAVGLFVLFFIEATGELMDSTTAKNSFHRFQTEPALQNVPLYSIDDMRPELVWQLGRKTRKLIPTDEIDQAELIGVFSPKHFNSHKKERAMLKDWEVISEEQFDQNPKESLKKPKVALKRYYTTLKKIH